ncbi:hypothetical protein DSTSK_22090 [Desulforhabdus sp. TSK]|nr:hypothetical protein [Desulforhabdus sp. TSK]GKT08904.1 hypothetical protein DSTSK_22090 [Desulforhabdus sp. TSK]
MKQVLQNLKDGKTELAEVPCPGPRAGHLLIRTHASLVSAGTEHMLLEFGKAGWIDKARQQPDKVKQVLQKIRTDGLAPTLEAVRSKLDQPIALGYCNVGEVVESGMENPGGQFEPGVRVVSNGAHTDPSFWSTAGLGETSPGICVVGTVGPVGRTGARSEVTSGCVGRIKELRPYAA